MRWPGASRWPGALAGALAGAVAVGTALLSAATAQERTALPRIGLLYFGSPDDTAHLADAFRQGLREHGHVEGVTVTVEVATADERADQLPDMAADLARRMSVIVALNSLTARAAVRATASLPIVLSGGAVDPVAEGFAVSLARPGRNVTGLSSLTRDLGPKQLELLIEAAPAAGHPVGVLFDERQREGAFPWSEVEDVARTLGLKLEPLPFGRIEEFEAAFARAAERGFGGVVVSTGPLTYLHAAELGALAIRNRLPTIASFRRYAAGGILMSYGADLLDSQRRAAGFVDKILKGARPGDLPIEQPTKFTLVINLKTANALGVAVPPSLLARADEAIE
jgi:putative tryptophan/tyrosine transport system substrate-binding protein